MNEPTWEKKLEQFREIGKITVSNGVKKGQSLLAVIKEVMGTIYRQGRADNIKKQAILNNDEVPEALIWRVDDMETSNFSRKKSGSHKKTRSSSPFIAEIEALGLKVGQYAYVSHKKWLDMGGDQQTVASQKNGPIYSLKRNGYEVVRGNLKGAELEAVAEADEIELNENEVIYSITRKAE